MRERTPLPREIIERLPRLKLIASTGPGNASIDMTAAAERGIKVSATGYRSTPTVEMTWALILAGARNLASESHSVRSGGWQTAIGHELGGKTLGVVGLGRIGGAVARIGLAFGMNIIAWSQNLTAEAAESAGATLVTKSELFRDADVVTIHLVLSRRTRGPIIDDDALIKALRAKAIAGAALDVFDQEPLPAKHPYRTLDNVLATPHVGYVSEDLYRTFYADVVENITAWLDEQDRGES
jgi:phosphoglycerate dehydrogenase-like enzyme